MNRGRLIRQIVSKDITVEGVHLKVVRELDRGGNGVAFLCHTHRYESVVAKFYIPPDKRDLDDTALQRFKNEIALTSKLRHPNIVRALGSGTLQLGAYTLPFYIMPFAAGGTLRKRVQTTIDPDTVEHTLRLFVRAALGVACLHSQGVIHRDLKPENILISGDGTPWIADLGIAHINPEFVSIGLKTIASERLLNRDYYAPEQRFGSATEVDHRADIYALGCILYELISGTPPVRNNSPTLQSISDAFAPLDPIVNRMTAYKASDRYPFLEDALEELSISLGWVLATLRGIRPPPKSDLPTMVKLLKSSNEANRQRGVNIARRLGTEALDTLHDLLGHGRRDVRNAVALALGEIRDPSSLRFLIGALYGTTTVASRYRPSANTAAEAVSRYPVVERLKSLSQISQPIRPSQIQQILLDVPVAEAYPAVLSLAKRGLILVDWSETELEILVRIDEERAWPDVKELLSKHDDFKVRHLIRYLSPKRQIQLMKMWLDRGITDSWYFEYILNTILELTVPVETRKNFLRRLRQQIDAHPGPFKNREELIRRIVIADQTID